MWKQFNDNDSGTGVKGRYKINDVFSENILYVHVTGNRISRIRNLFRKKIHVSSHVGMELDCDWYNDANWIYENVVKPSFEENSFIDSIHLSGSKSGSCVAEILAWLVYKHEDKKISIATKSKVPCGNWVFYNIITHLYNFPIFV